MDRSILSLVLLGAVVAVPALAQSQALSTYPECSAKQPSAEDSEAAHGAYAFGKRKYDEGEYATAISYFKDAYRTDCTKHEMLIIISRAYELSGNRGEAVNALEVYVKRVPNAPDADTQRRRIANLKAQMGTPATVPVPVGAPTSTGATTTPSATTTATTTATATPSATAAPTATATSETNNGEKRSPAPLIMAGAGGAAVVAGVVLVLVGANNVSSANDEFKAKGCDLNTHTCPNNKVSDAERNSINDKLQGGYRTETIGGVVIGIGAAAAAGGLIWYFVSKPSGKEHTAASSIDVRPVAGPGYAGAAVGGVF